MEYETTMISATEERAIGRVPKAAELIQADILVMNKGDEPMITPNMIEAAVAPMLRDETISCVNLAHRIVSPQEYFDPNTIKVVMDVYGNALYFSRAPIPAIDFPRDEPPVFKQVCVIPFRR